MSPSDPGPRGDGGGSPVDVSGDFYGPEDRSTSIRGGVVVVVAVVVGILLLPSATRAPESVTAGATTSTPPASTSGSHAAGGSGHSTPTTIPAPALVHVLVANGTTTNGVAGAVTTALSQKGYGTLTATNALTRVPASLVYPTAGSLAAAHEVAVSLGLPASSVQSIGAPAPVSNASGATVVVIAGPDLALRFAPAKS